MRLGVMTPYIRKGKAPRWCLSAVWRSVSAARWRRSFPVSVWSPAPAIWGLCRRRRRKYPRRGRRASLWTTTRARCSTSTARTNPFEAYVTITYGCDRFCSYCIVPYVRGRLQSRAAADILKETRTLIDGGVKEITLLGQNVDAYGKDLNNGYGFASLLRDVANQPGLTRLRFATSHPKDFDEDILAVMRERADICRAINLPVQAGSDRILREMNRGYTSGQYLALVDRIREALPDVSLTTDLIVGFPGETEEDFRASYELLKEVKFDIVHTAAYSPREGTRAAMMDGQIDNRVKAARLNEINALQAQIARSANEGYVGAEVEILADGPAPRGEGKIQGRTMTDKVVIIPGSEEDFGRLIPVRIVRASHWSLEGERI